MNTHEKDYWMVVVLLLFCTFATWIWLSARNIVGVAMAVTLHILTITVAIALGALIHKYWPEEIE